MQNPENGFKTRAGYPLLLAACAAAAFWPALFNGFVNWDDHVYLTENLFIRHLSWEQIVKAFTSLHQGLYKPVVLVSFMAEYHFFGLNPFVYHLNNLLLHAANMILVYWIILRLGARRADAPPAQKRKHAPPQPPSYAAETALLCALLFGVHPLRVESVAWVAERKDMLYSFFMLSAAACYLRYRAGGLKRYNALSVLLFLISLMSKAAGIILPGLLLLFDWFEGRKIDKKAVADKVPHIAAAGIFALANFLALQNVKQITPVTLASVWHNIPIAGYSVLLYLGKIIMPIKLSMLYPYPTQDPKPFIYYLSPWLVAAAAWYLWRRFKSDRDIVFGGAFFAVALFPFLQWVPLQPGIAMEHLTYIPAIGLSYIAARLGIRAILKLQNPRAAYAVKAAIAAVIIALGAGTFARSKVWKDSFSLWTNRLEKYPDCPIALINRSLAYLADGDMERALADINRTIATSPGFRTAYLKRSFMLYKLGRIPQAYADVDKALSLPPDAVEGRNALKVLPEAYYVRGNLGLVTGNFKQAVSDFSATLEFEKTYQAYNGRAGAETEAGDYKAALDDLNAALALNPYAAEIYANFGRLYEKQGDYAQAVEYAGKALAIEPRNPAFYFNRAVAYLNWHKFDMARADADAAISLGGELDPQFIKVLDLVSPRKRGP